MVLIRSGGVYIRRRGNERRCYELRAVLKGAVLCARFWKDIPTIMARTSSDLWNEEDHKNIKNKSE